MVTSVGRDAATSGASIRAGLTRPVELLLGRGGDLDDQYLVIGHPMLGYTDGFFFIGRWARLVAGAVVDLYARLDTRTRDVIREACPVVVVLPAFTSRYLALEHLSEAEARALFLQALRTQVEGRIPNVGEATVLFADEAEAVHALAAAIEILEARSAGYAMVCFADSLVDEAGVGWLEREGRLKVSDEPSGTQPGEAAACVLVTLPDGPGTTLCTWAADRPPDSVPGVDVSGRCLAGALAASLHQAGLTAFEGTLLLDLNGEHWKAKQLGSALSLLGARFPLESRPPFVPSANLGFLGSATLGVALVLALIYARHGAPWHQTLLVVQSATGLGASVVCTQTR